MIKKQTSSYYQTVDADTQTGFAHVLTTDNLCIQCCLVQRKNGEGYKKAVDKNDSGINDGICGDVNKPAFKKYGEAECKKFLFSELRKIGVKIL